MTDNRHVGPHEPIMTFLPGHNPHFLTHLGDVVVRKTSLNASRQYVIVLA